MFNPEILLAIKAAMVIGEAIYGIFAYIVVRQVVLMTKTFDTEFSPVFKVLAYAHFYAVLGLIVMTLLL